MLTTVTTPHTDRLENGRAMTVVADARTKGHMIMTNLTWGTATARDLKRHILRCLGNLAYIAKLLLSSITEVNGL